MTTLAIIVGQSNAGGYGMSPATLPVHLASASFGQTYIWGANYGMPWFGTYQPGANSGSDADPGAWAGEAPFAHDFRAGRPDEMLVIVKVTMGSTTLAQAPGADWHPDSPGELFDLTTANINRAKAALAANGVTVDHEVVLWMQGESDAGSAPTANAYADNLGDFLAAARAEWLDDPAGKVIGGRIADSPMPYNLTVRQAQWQVDQADADFATFKTIGFDMQPDGIHYGAGGHVAIGAAYYDAFDLWF